MDPRRLLIPVAPKTPEVIVLGGDPLELQLLPSVGGRLHRLRAFGHDLIRTPPSTLRHATDPYFWGGYVMAPWCNRMSAVPTVVGERTIGIAPGFPDGTAIHGQVATVPWARRGDGALVVRGGGDGWPWPYEVVERVSVAGASVGIALAITNLADDPMPAGIGLHPWFVGPPEMAIASSRVVPSNVDPVAVAELVAGRFDLRRIRPLSAGLDATWLDVADPAVELRWPSFGLEATMRLASDAGVAVAVASPAGVGAVAIEPQTHAPWGLRRFLDGAPHSLRLLPPGASLTLTIEIEVRRPG